MGTNGKFDVVVVGGGSGGYSTALRAAQLGLDVALVERDLLGGTCLHRGCIPTKAFLHAAEIADGAREAGTFGVRAAFGGIDPAALATFKNGVVTRLHRGLEGLLAAADKITVVRGTGKLVSPTSVSVDGTELSGSAIVLATGSVARVLPGLEPGGRVLTSTEALELSEVPASVVIVGGSTIGVEFASLWKSFGAEVTVLEALPRLVPQEDPMLSRHLERAFRKRGIGVRKETRVAGIEPREENVVVLLESGEKIEAEYVLSAVGRAPATAGIGLEELGIVLDDGWIRTNERLVTDVPGVYAVGDVVRGLQLAHRGFAHGIFVAEEIAGLDPEPVRDDSIPRVTYCDPELASVGLTEAEARKRYGDVQTYEYNLGGNGRSQILGTTGVVKLVRAIDGPVVGIHMIGTRMGEQSGEAALTLASGLPPHELARLIHAHPTQGEALGEAALALAGKPLHSHP
ncbi:dihydrolipoamide dehydrogenase [Rhodococcus ruber BKS 20-38]|uniref:Dihydrolipoyl dehydrogenase n=1 Tax=Rhodococcus ruber BKS 20-38 TaxID=1278076 RepID=M2ZJ03_9NOCA|nr:dihydrolipoyl dehydrogenase [Rhodococcus ruber]EME67277.1 dihydrolipoamide dehydrogenase [Rhodococcus ruber BKS 20-38]